MSRGLLVNRILTVRSWKCHPFLRPLTLYSQLGVLGTI